LVLIILILVWVDFFEGIEDLMKIPQNDVNAIILLIGKRAEKKTINE
jgi:hypothetical protein